MNQTPVPWISKLRIANFKSIESAELEFGPLTVLVGANSAGKSSVLQTLVLLSQILREPSQGGTVNLNGAELQLGTFTDIKHTQTRTRSVTLSIDLYSLDESRTRIWRHLRRQGLSEGHSPQQMVSWGIVLERPESTQMGSAKVARVDLETTRPDGSVRARFRPTRDAKRAEEAASHRKRLRRYRQGFGFSRGVDANQFYDAQITAPASYGRGGSFGPEATRKGMKVFKFFSTLDSGLPTDTFRIGKDAPALAAVWLEGIETQIVELQVTEPEDAADDNASRDTAMPRKRSPQDVPRAVELLYPYFVAWVRDFDSGDAPDRLLPRRELRSFLELSGGPQRLRADRPFRTFAEGPFGHRVQQELASRLEQERPAHETLLEAGSQFDDLAWGLRQRLSTSLWYLGPLREDPSPAYRPGQGGGIARLGLKGEYTVPALERFGSSQIEVILPPASGQLFPSDGAPSANSRSHLSLAPSKVSLAEAVDLWMAYLGVASAVRTRATGRAGIELGIIDYQTDIERTLTDVGVGVSQLLPVVVMCLRAQRGDVVLIEQPELHLHPAPQQALGDFLLAMSLSGRQVIVETHSEYLINRLRLRIAEDDTEMTAEIVKIIYAERRDGKTQFRPIRPNSYGSFDDWPDDFFDQAPKETEAILRAAMAKRKRQRERIDSGG